MNGIRIYTPESSADSYDLYYTRRGDGPIYRWQFEAVNRNWRFRRMNVSEISTHELCMASWKSVPDHLQTALSQHYIE